MGLSFISPFFISAAFLFGFGIWRLYRTRGDGTDRIVSSVVLLRKFKKTPLSKKDPKIPIRFFLECLIALLLSLIVAGVSFNHRQQKALIVMDLSLSTEIKIDKQNTFQDLLRKTVNDYFSGLDFATNVDLITTDQRTLEVDIDENILQSKIQQSKNPHRDDLLELFSHIALNEYDSIFIASDKDVVLRKFSGTLQNVSKSMLPPKENVFFDGEDIRNISDRSVSGTIQNASIIIAANSLSKYEKLLSRNDPSNMIKFTAQQWQDDRVERDSQIEVSVDNSKILVLQDDTIRTGYTGLPKGYLALTNSSQSNERLHNQVRLDSSDDFIEKSINNLVSQNIVIQKMNGETVEGPFSWWNDESVLLRYLSPSLINRINGKRLQCPSWMSIDLKISGKDVLCHGKKSGNTVVLSGLTLLPFGVIKSRFFDILTLNIFQFVFSKDSSGNPLIEESMLDTTQVVVEEESQVTSQKDITESKNTIFYARLIITALFLILFIDLLYFLKTKKFFGRYQ